MQLFSNTDCPQCHRVRIVMHEKDVGAQEIVAFTDDPDHPEHVEDLKALNPEATTPTFYDRGMTLLEPSVIMEYLDDRFPHPPLMPVDPIGKARARVWLLGIERNLYGQLKNLYSPGANKSKAARETMQGFLQRVTSELRRNGRKYFVGDNFSLLDASLAPILWRLEVCYGIPGKNYAALWSYAKGIYARNSFQLSLTDTERDLHRARNR